MEAYEKLEAEWASWNDLDPKGMVACSSGTAALHLALEALELPLGSEIVTGDFNMVSVPRAITLVGHVPVFVDCDERLLMDWALAGSAVNVKTRAFLPVHVYGRAVGMIPGHGWQCSEEEWGWWVVEDLAEAHGVKPHAMTDAACWSFYRNKIVHGSEGGMVWFRDPKYAEAARELRCLGFTKAHDFWHRPRGHNYRMSNEHAQLIRLSLLDADRNLEERRRIEGWYDERCPKEWRMPPRDVVWVYDLNLPVGPDRDGKTSLDRVVEACKQVGIEARHSFKPMSQQEEFQSCRLVAKADYLGTTNAESYSWRVMYLPVQPGVTTRESVHRAFDVIEREIG